MLEVLTHACVETVKRDLKLEKSSHCKLLRAHFFSFLYIQEATQLLQIIPAFKRKKCKYLNQLNVNQ